MRKVEKLLCEPSSSQSSEMQQPSGSEPMPKKMKLLDQPLEFASDNKKPIIWVKFGKQRLEKMHREEIETGKRLSDIHISFAQELIKAQFQIVGLQSPLLQNSRKTPGCCLQIVFCRSNHWIVASTIKGSEGKVCVYDSLYDELDDSSMETIQFLFDKKTIEMVAVQKQHGCDDCGLFAIANAVHLAKGHDPSKANYSQALMRCHLIVFKSLKCSNFQLLISINFC